MADSLFTAVFLFGVKTGPLVWGRVASLLARTTQSLFCPSRARLQIFADDPLLSLKRTREQREDIKNKVLMLWLPLGLKVAWKKGTVGFFVERIGDLQQRAMFNFASAS